MAIHRLNWSKAKGWTHDGKVITEDGMYCDGNNLYYSRKNGGAAESWIFRYKWHGCEQSMGLGSTSILTLQEAREIARKYCQLRLEGKNPKAERDGVRLDQDHAKRLAKTFDQVVDEYVDERLASTSTHRKQQFSYQRPKYLGKIGAMPIEKIDTKIILDILQKLWTEKNPTAVVLHSHLKCIFELAITKGYYTHDNPAAWSRLKPVLRPSRNVHRAKHHASLPYKDMGRFMATLRPWEDKSGRGHGHIAMARLIEFIILSGVRLSEARLATFGEMDFDNMIWTVPWQHLKMGRIHKRDRPIPITPPMLEVIKQIQKKGINQGDKALIFPSYHGGPYKINSCSRFIGYTLKWESEITLHGFRSTLRDWCRANGYPNEWWEIQVDHVLGDKTSQSYGHDPLLEQRRQMMTAWGEHCDRPTPATGTNVAQINEARKRRRSA
jgi:integrase